MLSAEFEYRRVDVAGVTINCAVAGAGSPVLLLHGYPQNHLMWRQVAPALVRDHTVVLADLRAYGDSDKPPRKPSPGSPSSTSCRPGTSCTTSTGKWPRRTTTGSSSPPGTFVGRGYAPLSVWQEYAIDVRGAALPTGHFLPEEAPALVTAALRDFLA